jgi:hypothetical protein
VLGGELFDGFADRDDLEFAARRHLARLAERYAPGNLSGAQRALLSVRVEVGASDLLRALAQDEADLDAAFAEGLYDTLDEEAMARARSQPYPLPIGTVAEITGATQRQIRHWEEQNLLRAHSVGGQKRYLRGGVLRAMALVKQEQHVIATLGKTVQEPRQLIKLIALVVSSSADPARVKEVADEFLSVGAMLQRSMGSGPSGRRAGAVKQTSRGPRQVATRPPAIPSSSAQPRKTRSRHAGLPTSTTQEVHVLLGEQGWEIKAEGARLAGSIFPTQAAAAKAAVVVARQNRWTLLVHRRDGLIRTRRTFA